MTTTALVAGPARPRFSLTPGLQRLARRIAALRRRRHYPSVRSEHLQSVDRWALAYILHRS